MDTEIKAAQDAAKTALADAETIREAYRGKSEAWSKEDDQRFGDLMDVYDSKMAEVERLKRTKKARAALSEPEAKLPQPSGDADGDREKLAAQASQIFKRYLRHGEKGLGMGDYDVLKAYQVDSDIEGGYLQAPEQFIAQLIQGVDDAVAIRGMATVIQVPKAESLGVPTLDTDLSDADWTTELATGSEDTSLRFGKRELFPHPLAKRVKLSRKLIRSAAIDPENLIRDRLSYKFGVTQEKSFLTGTGTGQPLGVFVASTDGISTSRDVNTGNATDVTADGIINWVYSMKPQYWGRMRMLFHRDVLRNIRKLKDGNGDYIWRSGLVGNTEPTILEIPYMLSEFAPNTFSNGNYAAVVGDWSYYWIAEALSFGVQVLNELYAETNQIGYIGRTELDGMPVLEEAFARLKFSA